MAVWFIFPLFIIIIYFEQPPRVKNDPWPFFVLFLLKMYHTITSSLITTFTRNISDTHSIINILIKIFILEVKQIFIHILTLHIYLFIFTLFYTHIIFHFFSNMLWTFPTLFNIFISINKMLFASIYVSCSYFVTKNICEDVQFFFFSFDRQTYFHLGSFLPLVLKFTWTAFSISILVNKLHILQ